MFNVRPNYVQQCFHLNLRGGSRISKGGVDGRPYLLAGGSRISSGELDDADDVEGFSLRVLKKGVCIDHF